MRVARPPWSFVIRHFFDSHIARRRKRIVLGLFYDEPFALGGGQARESRGSAARRGKKYQQYEAGVSDGGHATANSSETVLHDEAHYG